jgi:hypothetical protein
LNFDNNIKGNFLVFGESAFVACGGLFFKFLTLFTLGGHNVFNFIPFLMIFNATNAPIGGVQIFFGHHKKWKPSFWIQLALSA